MEKILAAAAEILAESGLPGLNTNAIAARAEVNVATLYSYFPDKIAILQELSARFEDIRGRYFADRIEALATAPDWRLLTQEIILRLAQFRAEVAGGVALRRALQAVPELGEIDDSSTRRSAGYLADAMCLRNPRLSRDRAYVVALVTSETVSRLLDLAFRDRTCDKELLDETITICQAYMAPYCDVPEPGRP
ncbi:TetR/AcrR family transcriptional regulator [Kitasatospora sp. NPDC059571]|uniref:TetR/AcrR family transcriptional regulator n=1 Tax=Kitasatospora sp. NPDC059571 TaxID=3346871 RepID=UPI00368B53B0